MDQATLVDTHIESGEQLIEELRRSGFNVAAAAWLRTGEEGQWFLYIASTEVDRKGLADAYKFVYLTTQRLQNLWLDPFDVKLIGADNPIAKDILDIQQRRYPAPIPTRFRGTRLGSIHIEEAYIYPPAIP
jgi:hypothetical protein